MVVGRRGDIGPRGDRQERSVVIDLDVVRADPQAVYGEAYYRRYFAGPGQVPGYGRWEPWLGFFQGIARGIVQTLAPHTVLDVGCAYGMLVEALRDLGVEAMGCDLSAFAIEHVRSDVRPYCWVQSVADPLGLGGPYDLVVSIETLEHILPEETDAAVANCCHAAKAAVLFSSTDTDHEEPTHINMRGFDAWAAAFGQHGFGYDAPYDASYICAHAALFRRGLY